MVLSSNEGNDLVENPHDNFELVSTSDASIPSITSHAAENTFPMSSESTSHPSRSPSSATTDITGIDPGTSENPPELPERQGENESLIHTWRWECTSTFFALVHVTLIITLFIYIDGNPIEQWSFSLFQPSALVAVFSNIIKALLFFPLAECMGQLKWVHFEKSRPLSRLKLFDDASRGPWGAVLLLRELKSCDMLAALGAVVIVSIFAFEPFAQRAITYVTRDYQHGNSNGSIFVSKDWAFSNRAKGWPIDATTATEIPLTAAIINSLKRQVYDLPPNYICPGTECNITDVEMIAVCSTCKSEVITMHSFDGCLATVGRADEFDYATWARESLMSAPEFEQKIEPLLQELNYQPLITGLDHQELIKYLVENIQSNYSATKEFNVVINCRKAYLHITPLDLRIYANSQVALLSHQQGSYEKAEMSTDLNMSDFMTIEGDGFTSCRYSGMSKIQYNEQPRIAQATCFSSKTHLYLYGDLKRIGEVNGTVTSCDLEFCVHRYDSIVIRNGQKTYHGLRKERFMPLDTEIDLGLSYWHTSSKRQRDFIIHTVATRDLTTLFLRSANITISESVALGRTRKNFENVTLLFERFAEGMSFATQSYTNPTGTNVTMQVFDEEQVFQIQWAFMTVPFVTVFSGCIFIALTIHISKTRHCLLKTSILAAMFHGPDASDVGQEHEDDLDFGSKRKVSDEQLMKRAKKISMVFEQLDGERRRLRKV